ncbi:ParB/RepB/Spo0J family partition protein [Streptomyces chartreusis]|uniref:ParB/RepB/Spo0J family partition protein n=1 Tax=Streptomyces chartreusis TaxID=1969 RepID=UPI003D74C944
MTKTQNKQTAPAASTEATEAYAARFVWIDPLRFRPDDDTPVPADADENGIHVIVVDPFNHRKRRASGDTTEPTPDLIASVEAVGVQQAIVLRPQKGSEGVQGVVMGQRRIKAARLAALKAMDEGRSYNKVPGVIRDDLKGVDDEAIVSSMVENNHRTQASVQDDVEAAQQLTLLVEAKRIPKDRRRRMATALGLSEEHLDAAPKVAKIAAETLKELDEDDVEFDWIELADYDEIKEVDDALWTLQDAKEADQRSGDGKRGAWTQAMAELRAVKARDERIEATKKDLDERKVKIVEWQRYWGQSRPLEELVSAIGRPLTEQGHTETCRGHAAAIDPEDGELLYLCTDYKKYGHKRAGAQEADTAEAEAAIAQREAEREEKRRVRLKNAAWRTARQPREEFLAKMCQDRGEAPAHIKDMVLTTLLKRGVARGPLLTRFLGADAINTDDPQPDILALVKRTAARRYWWVLFAHVAAMYEYEHMKDDAWRGTPHYHYGLAKPGAIAGPTAEWMRFLKSQGYTSSEIEQEVLAQADQEAEERAKKEADRHAAEVPEDGGTEEETEPDEPEDGGTEEETEPDEPEDGGTEEETEPDGK